MKLQQLRYFVAVYEEGSVTAGAERAHATQSGLSMQIKDLEERYDVVLFDRAAKGVHPTEMGRRLYEYATRILKEVAEAEQGIKALKGIITGHIRVGLMPDSIWQMITRGPDPHRELELALAVGFAESDLARSPTELSMGDLRKLEMARTMATAPRVMLLDEVFAGLTVGEIAQISDLIQSMRKDGMTFLIVSHDLKALEPLVDRAIAINHGRKIAEGSFAEVLADDDVRASYLGDA